MNYDIRTTHIDSCRGRVQLIKSESLARVSASEVH
jgi:hypothetical protein